jgi:hypothetical protein
MTPRRLPRAVRLDGSDLSAFERAAIPGEWAVSGGFAFLGYTPDSLDGKRRLAFSSAFLGVASFGWSTFVTVEEAGTLEQRDMIESLARIFIERFGAPSLDEARDAARAEVDFAASLCDHPVGTLLTVSRRFEGDEVVEQFATLTPDDPLTAIHASPIDLVALASLHQQ